MDFSSFLSASVPASHSSAIITDSAHLAGVDFDWLSESMKLWNPEVSDSCGDGSPSSPPQGLTRRPSNIIQQSVGFFNHSLQSNDLFQHAISSSSPSASLNGAGAAENLAKRTLFTAGDFQKTQRAESPVSCESSITIEGMSRACRYSPEEKKERIERYRSKRNQRNFNKKIKYACRKSLADSRPRIRGRFARYNDEVVKNYPVQWSHGREEEEDEEDEANGGDNWIKYFIDAYSTNLIP